MADTCKIWAIDPRDNLLRTSGLGDRHRVDEITYMNRQLHVLENVSQFYFLPFVRHYIMFLCILCLSMFIMVLYSQFYVSPEECSFYGRDVCFKLTLDWTFFQFYNTLSTLSSICMSFIKILKEYDTWHKRKKPHSSSLMLLSFLGLRSKDTIVLRRKNTYKQNRKPIYVATIMMLFLLRDIFLKESCNGLLS